MEKTRLPPGLHHLSVLLLGLVCLGGSASADPVIGDAPQQVRDTFVPEVPGWQAAPWVEGLEIPWSLVFLPDGRALVSERPGRIRLIEDGLLRQEPYAELDVAHIGEGGLMGLALHPRFPEQPYVYAMLTYRGERGLGNRVIRLEHVGEHARFDRVILDNIPGARFHNGGRIAFGPDGMLYVATGELFEADLAQRLDSLAGKILRITPEGEIPPDNPSSRSPIYSYGHRNPQGLAWHPETGELYASEHGPSGEFGFGAYDEINIIRPGRNYGWPLKVGAAGVQDLEDPLAAWVELTTPPGGMAFYGSDLFVATLRSEALLRIELAEDGRHITEIERWFAEDPRRGRFGRLRDVVVGPDGALYLLTSNKDGRGTPRPNDDTIYRIAPVR
jgi:glucose/arabinose dehydrogenase